eukprot:CAMPEP_0197117244 /NCGR_PEP_ID=MMETSP1390-20130617/668_1 /TAXON_ID=38833 /ORGANISM="Micromonas sp., Strain CCMP2099" /LENGTH=109 /DNA_ID=CAMNT_0042558559 /DNA_START=1355 /DNA_END=1681 /DNA_ORIENTATION=-
MYVTFRPRAAAMKPALVAQEAFSAALRQSPSGYTPSNSPSSKAVSGAAEVDARGHRKEPPRVFRGAVLAHAPTPTCHERDAHDILPVLSVDSAYVSCRACATRPTRAFV